MAKTLRRGDSAAAAFGRLARNCLDELEAHQGSVRKRGDSVGIHRMRVALRRLRAGFVLFAKLFGPDALAELTPELRWLAGELAPARDWDVFATQTLAPGNTPAVAASAAQRVRKAAAASRATARRRAIAAIRSPRYAALALALGSWVETERWREGAGMREAGLARKPVDKLAARLIERREAKTRKAGRAIADLSVEQRHALRKRLKTLRYGASFLAPLFKGKRVKRYLKALGAMQDKLGTINDLAVARGLLIALREEERGALGGAITLLDAALAAELADRLTKLPAGWREFKKMPPFWR
jgi:CHAD domain-containing protein